MQRPIAKSIAYVFIAASAFLSGCETVGGLKTDADMAIKAINASIKSASNSASNSTTNRTSTNAQTARVVHDGLNAYQSFVTAEGVLIRRIDEQQRSARLSTVVSEKTVTLISGGRSQQFLVAGSFRTELPGDAIAARHRSVLSFIDSIGEYVARRSEMEPSNLVIAARSQADAAWMKESAVETLTRLGFANVPVTTEININTRTKPMIGWYSTGPSTRNVQKQSYNQGTN